MTNHAFRKTLLLVSFFTLIALLAWKFIASSNLSPASAPIATKPAEDVIPAGIIVTENSSAPPPQTQQSPSNSGITNGDRLLTGYADPAMSPQNDMRLIANAISTFFVINKQASQLPLSANEEWAAALSGKRSGIEQWISEKSPALDSKGHLIDRWGTPLHFHSLGGKVWKIRSAGPDRKQWTADDLLEKTSG
jgi:hypothetical protein